MTNTISIDIHDFDGDIAECAAELLCYDLGYLPKEYDGDDVIETVIESMREEVIEAVKQALWEKVLELKNDVENTIYDSWDMLEKRNDYQENPESILPWIEELKDVEEGEIEGVKLDGETILNYFVDHVLFPKERAYFKKNHLPLFYLTTEG